MSANGKAAVCRTVWRWHFYAGLMVMPLILILSMTGALYLFKPQVERWEERTYQGLDMRDAVSPDRQVDAAMIHLAMVGGTSMRDVFVSPQGRLGAPPLPPDPVRLRGIFGFMLVLTTVLPLFAASLVLLWTFERLLLPRLPNLARWLGTA